MFLSMQVWDAISGTSLAIFTGHSARLFSGMFSGVDADVVYTGSDDGTFIGWKISENVNSLPPKKSNKKPIQV